MIRNWTYLDEYERERGRILEIVDRVFSSGRLILGAEVANFEERFAAYCGVPHGVGVNSGTDALFLALKALGIGAGDEVVTVSNTAVPTIAAIRASGATPVFVDVEEDTFLMDAGDVERALTKRTKCILPVHLFGQAADMDRIKALADRHRLHVVEDCAQAAGALYQGHRVGGFGDIAAFSFYPTKLLGGYGDGGMVLTRDRARYERLKRLRFYGMNEPNYSSEEGYNSRLDEVQAALLNHKLASLDSAADRRRDRARLYSEGLASVGDLALPAVRSGRSHQFYVYTVRTKRRDRLMRYLEERGIETRIHYPVPIHLMTGYRFLGYGEGALPVTERLAREILALPLYPDLAPDDAQRVVSCVRSFFDGPPGGAA